jgi:hypothetical protein
MSMGGSGIKRRQPDTSSGDSARTKTLSREEGTKTGANEDVLGRKEVGKKVYVRDERGRPGGMNVEGELGRSQVDWGRGWQVGEKEQSEGSGGNKESARDGRRKGVMDSILGGGLSASHPLKLVAEEYIKRGEDAMDVAYVPTPVDGNKMYILREERRGISDGIGDAAYWATGKTTNVALKGRESVRKFKCLGKHVCKRKEGCEYWKKNGKDNSETFTKTSGDVLVCFYCDGEAEKVGSDCGAEKFVVKGKGECAYVHWGNHNHSLGVVEDQGLLERMKVRAMLLGEADATMTPSKFVQVVAQERLVEAMKPGGKQFVMKE